MVEDGAEEGLLLAAGLRVLEAAEGLRVLEPFRPVTRSPPTKATSEGFASRNTQSTASSPS